MRYQRGMILCFLILCLIVSAVYTDTAAVLAKSKSNVKIRVHLKMDNQTVSGKTISVKKGNQKNIKASISVPKEKKYKITFRSNRPRIVSVSKTGKLTAKETGSAKVTVTVKIKKKKYKRWIKIRVVSPVEKKENTSPTESPSPTVISSTPSPTVVPPTTIPIVPSDIPSAQPSDTLATTSSVTLDLSPALPVEGDESDSEDVLDMYNIEIRINGREFSARLYQTKTTEVLMQKLPLSIMMNELNGNEKYYYFSENFPTDSQKVSQIHAGDLKLYGSSCLVLFYESFSTSYSYTSLGYIENPEGLAEVLGTGNVSVEIVGLDK